MCGRFFLTASRYELEELFELPPGHDLVDSSWFTARYNVPPSEAVIGVALDEHFERKMDLYRWGLVPSWVRDLSTFRATTINARVESVATKPLFRAAFRQRRVLIPASGFFEWDRKDPKAKQPYAFVRTDGRPMAIAGLWEPFRNAEGHWTRSCAILTASGNEDMPIHDRAPVVLEREAWDKWLDPSINDPEELQDMLRLRPGGILRHYPVDRRVGSVSFDGPECIEPIELVETQSLL